MPLLALNGITVPIRDETLTRANEVIGETKRAFSGALRTNRRAIKKGFVFELPVKESSDALAWEGLINGLGHSWDFDSNAYSSKGLPWNSGSNATLTSPAKFGVLALSLPATTGAHAYNVNHNGSAWSVWVWRYESSVWRSYLVRSDGAKWFDGSRNDSVSSSWLTVSTNTLTLSNTTGASQLYDDLVFLPYLVPTDWPAAVHSSGAAFGALPKHRATGDLIGSSALTMTGEAGEVSYTQAYINGVWEPDAQMIPVTLREV